MRHIVQLPILQSLTIISPMFQCTLTTVSQVETKRKFIPVTRFVNDKASTMKKYTNRGFTEYIPVKSDKVVYVVYDANKLFI